MRDRPTSTRRIPRSSLASLLYTPALDAARIAKARATGAGVCLLDLEDSVPLEKKRAARAICLAALQAIDDGIPTAVRINELRCRDGVLDLDALLASRATPDVVLLTMVESGAEIEIVRTLFARSGKRPLVWVTVETPAALEAIDGIARLSDGLVLGSADLAAYLGVDIGWENMLYARQRLVPAAARYGIAAIDTACFDFADGALVEESQRVKALGFHGKAAVHPSQVDVINRVFRPTEHELAVARRTVEAAGRGGVCRLDGKMIGPPFVKKAERLLAMSGTTSEAS